MLMALIGGGLAGCSHNCYDRGQGCFSAPQTTGKVLEEFVAGSTVTLDTGNTLPTTGQCTGPTTTTHADGSFTFDASLGTHAYCATGGTYTNSNGATVPLVGTLM